MFAVVGTWEISPASAEAAAVMLNSMIVPGVAHSPGIVKGYWSGGVSGGTAHTYIVFAGEDAANAFASSVRGNAANQREFGVHLTELCIEPVTAET